MHASSIAFLGLLRVCKRGWGRPNTFEDRHANTTRYIYQRTHARTQTAVGIILVIWSKSKKQKDNYEKLPQSSTSTRMDQSNDVGGSVGKDERDSEEDEGMDGQRSSQLQDNKCTDTGADAQMKRHCTDVSQHNAMTSI